MLREDASVTTAGLGATHHEACAHDSWASPLLERLNGDGATVIEEDGRLATLSKGEIAEQVVEYVVAHIMEQVGMLRQAGRDVVNGSAFEQSVMESIVKVADEVAQWVLWVAQQSSGIKRADLEIMWKNDALQRIRGRFHLIQLLSA